MGSEGYWRFPAILAVDFEAFQQWTQLNSNFKSQELETVEKIKIMGKL